MGACVSRAGVYSAVTSAAGVTPASRPRVDWLPPAHIPLDRAGKVFMTPVWYRFFREMAENRMGGINGATVPQVATAASAASATASTVGVFAQQVRDYAEEINTTVETTRQVSVDNSLTGAEDIPPGPSSPPQYEP